MPSAIVLLLTSHIQSEFFCYNCIIIFSIKYIYPRLVLMVAELWWNAVEQSQKKGKRTKYWLEKYFKCSQDSYIGLKLFCIFSWRTQRKLVLFRDYKSQNLTVLVRFFFPCCIDLILHFFSLCFWSACRLSSCDFVTNSLEDKTHPGASAKTSKGSNFLLSEELWWEFLADVIDCVKRQQRQGGAQETNISKGKDLT